MSKITATAKFHGQEVKDIPVLNPGGYLGKTWLLEIGGFVSPLFLVVEADTVQDAIDELADDETHGHHIVVAEADLGDYPEDSRNYGPHGQVIDLDHLMVHGRELGDKPLPCRYHGEGLPPEGVDPTEFCWDD